MQERHKGIPISGKVLMEKAISKSTSKTDHDFKASGGWLHHLKNQHGIRQLSMQGESLSAEYCATDEFKSSFPELIEEQG